MPSRKKSGTYEARVWVSRGKHYDFPDRKASSKAPPPSTGVCFSGGGTRALSAAMGQLRGLTRLGLIGKIGYISAVSGGAWASTAYTFYDSGARDDAQFLGAVRPPREITWAGLRKLPRSCLGHTATTDFEGLLAKFIDRGIHMKDVWIRAVGKTFLRPFGIFLPRRPAFFTLDEASRKDIVARNPSLEGATFFTARRNRPFLILNSCIIWPTNELRPQNLVGFEYTPLYVGSPRLLDLSYKPRGEPRERRTVGGGFVEPFAFGGRRSPAKAPVDGIVTVKRPPESFSLAAAAGTSSAAYSQIISKGAADLSPHARYWPVTGEGGAPVREFAFGDGGSLENYGLIALLLRKVRNVVVFINTPTKLGTRYVPDPKDPPCRDDMDSVLPAFFGVKVRDFLDQKQDPYPHNQVFRRRDFVRVVKGLQRGKRSKKTGGTAVTVTTLDVLPNAWWGVTGGWKVKIAWVYLDRVRRWERKLKPGIRAKIEEGNHELLPRGPLRHFPNYPTIGANLGDLIRLTERQVNLLAHLTCWTVLERSKEIRSVLG